MEKDRDALPIIIKAYNEMEADGVATYRDGKPNLAELSRRTGYTRKVLERLFRDGLAVVPHGNSVKRGSRVMTHECAEVAQGLLKQGVTNSSVIYDRLCETGYGGSLSTVKGFIADNKSLVPAKRVIPVAPKGRIVRYETAPGAMFQMDWGFIKVADMNGNVWQCACFVMVCHHCGQRYVEFFPNARQENLFIGMLHGFMYMGMPATVLTDNMASVSNRRDIDGNPIFNKEYDAFQQELGFTTKLCKARHPWTKGAVERLVKFVKGNFIQGRCFTNVTDLNMQALGWCEHENGKLQKGLGVIPAEVHQAEPLLALPGKPSFLPYLAPERKIGLDGFVYYEGRRYGVPYRYAGRSVRVLREKASIYIVDPVSYQVIEEHTVDWSYKPHYSPTQFEPVQPEEEPTQAVLASMRIGDGKGMVPDDTFKDFDF